MSLNITPAEILIKDQDGVILFTSEESGVFRRLLVSGSGSMSAGIPSWGASLGYVLQEGRDFPIVKITITSATGNVLSQFVGQEIALQFPILTHYVINAGALDNYELLTAVCIGGTLSLQHYNLAYFAVQNPSSSLTFNYKVEVLTMLP